MAVRAASFSGRRLRSPSARPSGDAASVKLQFDDVTAMMPVVVGPKVRSVPFICQKGDPPPPPLSFPTSAWDPSSVETDSAYVSPRLVGLSLRVRLPWFIGRILHGVRGRESLSVCLSGRQPPYKVVASPLPLWFLRNCFLGTGRLF